jgi:hypothetical protein
MLSTGWEYEKLSEKDISPFKQAVAHQAPASVINRFGPVIEKATTNAEILAHMWGLDYHLALQHHRQTEGQFSYLVTYEELLTQGQKCIQDLCAFLGEESNEEMMSQLGRSSRTASEELSPTKTSEQLQKWKGQLSDETIGNILSIVQMYDIKMYGSDILPCTIK